MPYVLPRLAAGALLAVSICTTAVADPQPTPASMQEILTKMHITKYSNLTLLDEQGQPMDPEACAQELKAGHKMSLQKKPVAGGDPEFTIRLVSKEESAKTVKVPAKLKEGDAFPLFQLAHLDGTAIDNSALAGKYTLVSFYFSTCAPCIREVPELNALAERRKDLNVVAVTYDSTEESKHFVDEHHLNWPVVPKANSLIHDAGVKVYPTLMLLDPQGKVVAFSIGGMSDSGAVGQWVDQFAAPKA